MTARELRLKTWFRVTLKAVPDDRSCDRVCHVLAFEESEAIYKAFRLVNSAETWLLRSVVHEKDTKKVMKK